MIATPDFHIISVGTLKNRHFAALVDDYICRLRHDARITIFEIRDSNRHQEGHDIITRIDKTDGIVFALSEEGSAYTSRAFATLLQQIPRRIIFVIGGPDGLNDEVKKRADRLLSLSSYTFTHEMARLLLAEQLYRACSIMRNRPYHRD